MTTKLLFLAAFLPLSASFLLSSRRIYPVADEVYRTLKITPPLNLAAKCIDKELAAAQSTFNTEIGIDPNLKWRNASVLDHVVRRSMSSGARAYLDVCLARTHFYSRMATMWDSCISRYHLLKSLGTATNISAPYVYVHMWKHLDFMCNAGAEIAMSNFFNLDTFQNNPGFEDCVDAFYKGLNDDPNSLCPTTSTFLKCASNAMNNYMGNPILAWYVCEEARVGFANDCPNLRCYVIPPPPKKN